MLAIGSRVTLLLGHSGEFHVATGIIVSLGEPYPTVQLEESEHMAAPDEPTKVRYKDLYPANGRSLALLQRHVDHLNGIESVTAALKVYNKELHALGMKL